MAMRAIVPLSAVLVSANHGNHAECGAACIATQAGCSAACLAVVWFPPAALGCIAACGVAAAACEVSCANRHRNCFGDGTRVHELENGEWLEKDVVDVEPGAMLLTLIDGEKQPTKVVSNRRVQGATGFVTLDVVDSCGFARALTVTSAHNMLVPEHGHLRMRPASEVHVGNRVASASCDSSFPNATTAVVAGMERQQLEHKNELITAHGTVLANGVFVTTICDSTEYSHYTDAQSAIAAWQADHAARWDMLSVDV